VHELYIAESIHKIVVEEAERGGTSRVVSLTLEIGALSGVVTDSLEFVFPAVSKGGIAENAKLLIDHVDASGKCPHCGVEFPIEDYYSPCPTCGHVPVEVTHGRELRVKEIEVE
jgi:hydrogenase nickel incorporation protein HypA/HybF